MKKKKNLVTLLCLLGLLALVLGLYFLVPQGGKEEEEKETISLARIMPDQVTYLQVKKGTEEAFTLVKTEDQWQFQGDEDTEVDTSALETALGNLKHLTASQALDYKEESLESYGLKEPAMTIEVEENGNVFDLYLGNSVPVEGGYYAYTSKKDKIYCVADDIFSAFDLDKKTLTQTEE